MKYLQISLGIFIVLAVSRFIPHPPNFTSLIALSFYVPVLFGRKFVAIVVLGFALTDLFIGFHQVILFTWGSIIFIGLLSEFFKKNILFRSSGLFLSAIVFFIISNFGVWLTGQYEYSLKGLTECYYMAIPFFGNTLLSTIVYSIVIEFLNSSNLFKKYLMKA